jgi:hypothetical protein
MILDQETEELTALVDKMFALGKGHTNIMVMQAMVNFMAGVIADNPNFKTLDEAEAATSEFVAHLEETVQRFWLESRPGTH